MKLNKDGTLSLPAMKLNAERLDRLLDELAHIRRTMNPAVPRAFELPEVPTMHFIDEPDLVFLPDETGFAIGVRHPGFGWISFDVSDANAATLQRVLARRFPLDTDHLSDEPPPDDTVLN